MISNLFETSGLFSVALIRTLFHSLWIGAVLYLLLRIFLGVFNGGRARHHYLLSVFFLGLYSLIIVLVFNLIYKAAAQVDSLLPGAELSLELLLALVALPGQTPEKTDYHTILIFLYAAGLFVFSLRMLLSYIRLRLTVSRSIQGADRFTDLLQSLRKQLGIRQNVRLLVSERIAVPALFSILRPVIIVPAGMLTSLPFNQVEAIFLHELMHLRRLDLVVNLVQSLIEVLFFFNPFVWLISRIIRDEREMSCDDAVVKYLNEPKDYVKALYNISSFNIYFISPEELNKIIVRYKTKFLTLSFCQ